MLYSQPVYLSTPCELEARFNSQNKSTNPDTTSIPVTFLRVTVAR